MQRQKLLGIILSVVLAAATVAVFLVCFTITAPGDEEQEAKFNLSIPDLGSLEGIKRTGTVSFYGVPYAKQPGRFEYPDYPPENWGHREAFLRENSAPICPQDCYDQYEWVPGCPKLETGGQSEQCLYLHITAPERVILDDSNEKLPVFVYLHGGSFTFGSGQSALYDGRYLSSFGDMVVVDVNYRLGVFGFMPYDGTWEGKAASGNFGLADQRRALEFVHDYIHYFGGDNTKVTLAGQSAGSESTYLHIMNDGRHQEFFRSGIMMSSPLALPLLPQNIAIESMTKALEDESKNATYNLGQNCDINCLKDPSQVDTATLFEISKRAEIPGFVNSAAGLTYRATHPLSLFQGYDPIVDGNLVNGQFIELSENRNDLTKPMMIGSVGDEGEGFVQALVPELFDIGKEDPLQREQYERMLHIIWTAFDSDYCDSFNRSLSIICHRIFDENSAMVDEMLTLYPFNLDCDRYHDKSDSSTCDAKEAANHWVRDYLFVCPQRKALQNLLKANEAQKQALPNLYWWYFDQPFPWIPPELNQQYFDSYRRCDEFACHGTDIAFIFGLDRSFPFVQFSEGDERLARVFMNYVSNFVHTQDPNDSSQRTKNVFTANLDAYDLTTWQPWQSQISDWSNITQDWGYQYLSGAIPSTSEFRKLPVVSLQNTDETLSLSSSCDMFDRFDQYDEH